MTQPVITRLRPLGLAALLLAALVTAACATGPRSRTVQPRPLTYAAADDGSQLARHAPVFTVERPNHTYNRIATPRARLAGKGDADPVQTEVFMDPSTPTLYVQSARFRTARGEYTNLIYRAHFERVPFRLRPSHISYGRNVGVLVIVTLDDQDRPLLYTTVHTCGCYLVFFPTTHLPASAYPKGWDPIHQKVWGERVPGRLPPAGPMEANQRPVFTLRDGTHRMMDARVMNPGEVSALQPQSLHLAPMEELLRLPVEGDGTTPLFEEKGRRRGYVKGSFKPLETILAGWWAWDRYVGSDKAFFPDATGPPVFYTSLKPWRRHASDMRDFARFLAYWGWGL